MSYRQSRGWNSRSYRGLQVAWHKNRDEIGACAKFGGNFELKFCACADFVAIFVPSNLQSSVLLVIGGGIVSHIVGQALCHMAE